MSSRRPSVVQQALSARRAKALPTGTFRFTGSQLLAARFAGLDVGAIASSDDNSSGGETPPPTAPSATPS